MFQLRRKSATPATAAAPVPAAQPDFPPWGTLLDEQLQRSERRAWRVAWCAAFIALLAVCGIVALAPFRIVVPFLLAVDQARGGVYPIGAVDDRAIQGYQGLLDKHWVQRYVVARESYVYRLLQEDYDTVYEMSEDAERERFTATYEGPGARDKVYGSNIEITVRTTSIQLSSNHAGAQATVRFSTVLRRLDTGASQPPRYYIVTLAYRYQPHMFGPELQLLRNPLGFKVDAYRLADELPPVEQTKPKGA